MSNMRYARYVREFSPMTEREFLSLPRPRWWQSAKQQAWHETRMAWFYKGVRNG